MARTFTPVNAMTKVKDSQTGKVNKSHWEMLGGLNFWMGVEVPGTQLCGDLHSLSWCNWLPPLLQSLPGACFSECHTSLALTDNHPLACSPLCLHPIFPIRGYHWQWTSWRFWSLPRVQGRKTGFLCGCPQWTTRISMSLSFSLHQP